MHNLKSRRCYIKKLLRTRIVSYKRLMIMKVMKMMMTMSQILVKLKTSKTI